jgi:hypothetical protein
MYGLYFYSHMSRLILNAITANKAGCIDKHQLNLLFRGCTYQLVPVLSMLSLEPFPEQNYAFLHLLHAQTPTCSKQRLVWLFSHRALWTRTHFAYVRLLLVLLMAINVVLGIGVALSSWYFCPFLMTFSPSRSTTPVT